jgi:hypothetical protein
MEPEGSLPYSQNPATCPYSQPDKSSPRPPLPPNVMIIFHRLRRTKGYAQL